MKHARTKENISLAQIIVDESVVGHFVTNSDETAKDIITAWESYIFNGHAREIYNVEYNINWAKHVLVLVDEGFDENLYFEEKKDEDAIVKNLYIVGITYASYAVQVNVYSVWADHADHAEWLAKVYKGECVPFEKDWSEYNIEVTRVEGAVTNKVFGDFISSEGWTRGDCPVQQVYSWGRG